MNFILGVFGVISALVDSFTNGASTFATNFIQCLEKGPRIVYTPLDFELPPLPTTTTTPTTEQPAAAVIVSGRTNVYHKSIFH